MNKIKRYIMPGIIVILVIICIILLIKNNKKKGYLVTIDLDDSKSIYKYEIDKGNLLLKPENPTRDGYEFEGWYVGDKQFDFNTKIEKDTKIKAKWKKIKTEEDSNSNSNIESNSNSDINSNSNIESNSNIKSNEKSNESNSQSNKTSNEKSNASNSNKKSNSKSDTQSNTVSNNTSTTNNQPSTNTKIDVSSVTLNKTSHSMNIGESVTLSATVSPSDATNKNVTWSSSNNGVATVSNGKVTAVSGGTTTITATADGKSATCTITVIKPETYTYEMVDVPGSTTGQVYIYIKNSQGTHVNGSLTITYKNGKSENVNISSNGNMFPSKSVISSITNVQGS